MEGSLLEGTLHLIGHGRVNLTRLYQRRPSTDTVRFVRVYVEALSQPQRNVVGGARALLAFGEAPDLNVRATTLRGHPPQSRSEELVASVACHHVEFP